MKTSPEIIDFGIIKGEKFMSVSMWSLKKQYTDRNGHKIIIKLKFRNENVTEKEKIENEDNEFATESELLS